MANKTSDRCDRCKKWAADCSLVVPPTGCKYDKPGGAVCAECCEILSKPKPMTPAQAREEAKRRWGVDGHTWKMPSPIGRKYARCVGAKTGRYRRYNTHGIGATFEAAFADADRRENESNAKNK